MALILGSMREFLAKIIKVIQNPLAGIYYAIEDN